MRKKILSAGQTRSVIGTFLVGSSLVAGASVVASRDTWFTVILGFLFSIPMMAVQTGILNLYPGRSYYGNILRVYGRIGGRIVLVLLLFYSLHLGGLVLREFSEFIRIVNMTGTPLSAVGACIVGVTAFVVGKRMFVVARVSKFVFPLIAGSISLTALLAIKDMDFTNIQPMLQSSVPDLARGGLVLFSFPFGELTACAPVFRDLDAREKIFPVFLRGGIGGFLLLLVANLRNMLVLGYSSQIFPFASYQTVSVIMYGEFFTRIEVLIGINLLLAGFIKVCVLTFSAASACAELFGMEDYVPFVVPCSMMIFTISIALHANTDEMYGWLDYTIIYSLPFQVFIPVLTLLLGLLQKRGRKRKRTPRPRVRRHSGHPGRAAPQP